jgi:hypothetical protein
MALPARLRSFDDGTAIVPPPLSTHDEWAKGPVL